MDVKELQRRIGGKVTGATDDGYEQLRREMSWNQLTPARYPRLIVQASSEQDVVEAVRFARTHGMKIAVRGGGHSWVGFSLRDESLLLDLGHLRQVSVNPEARTAAVQPAVTGRELNRQLAPHGLAFPVGHSPSVPLSGFLLNGGLGWNFNSWGPACFSVEAARVVTAEGRLIVANQEQDADLLWAIRGGGPGFFGVVTQYQLKLYPAPRATSTSTYFYPLERIEEVGAWAADVAGRLRREVELTIFVAPAPPALAERCRTGNGFVAVVGATAFLDGGREAAAALGLLESCPIVHECLHKEVNQPTPFDALLDMGGVLWPERHRYLVDTLWSDSPPAEQLATVRDYFLRAPSPKSLALCVFATGPGGRAAALPDAAFSMTARTLLLCYAIWERPEGTAANTGWHREMIAALDRCAVGHYVGESDIVAEPERAERSFARANWQRLQALRRRYDPDGLFHGHFSAGERSNGRPGETLAGKEFSGTARTHSLE
jgi:FAD/FMN-containing dehydrogenase